MIPRSHERFSRKVLGAPIIPTVMGGWVSPGRGAVIDDATRMGSSASRFCGSAQEYRYRRQSRDQKNSLKSS